MRKTTTTKNGCTTKPTSHCERTREYCSELVDMVKNTSEAELPAVKESVDFLSEMLDDQVDCYDQSIDTDARIGHKSINQSFYGYKTHIALSEERIRWHHNTRSYFNFCSQNKTDCETNG